ncbi:phosphatase PAP2 family protein [Carnobacterium mobile]|uniref:phosphatase PAP2 family protein n=1 Tax=Carnobacterium mobile TaxID=2750 RepID=UPI0005507AD7|nr:phosphatase PAP2 family protein [Carnobacterium mobile]
MHTKKFVSQAPYFTSFLLFFLFSMVAFGLYVQADWIHSFDQFISQPILDQRAENKTTFFIAFTHLGSVTAIVLSIVFFSSFLFWRTKQLGIAFWFALQALLGAGLLNHYVKEIFQRQRPTIKHLVVQGGYSFPSGHSMGSLICYGGIAFLLIQLTRRSIWKRCILFFTAVLVFLIGISRIYVGVHFPSDVLGGYLLGGAWLFLMIALYPRWLHWFNKRTSPHSE